MPLKINWIGKFDPFDFISCPVCGRSEFVSTSASAVHCNFCETRFKVRMTAGDPGCVVDADTTDGIYAPAWKCPNCSLEIASFNDAPGCPHCLCLMKREERCYRSFPQDKPRRWYWILKLGDYSSGWLDHEGAEKTHSTCKDPDLQAKWDAFQERFSNKQPLDIDKYIDAACQHGLDSNPDHEVGDLQDLLRAMWEILSPEQKKAFTELPNIKEVLANGTGEALSSEG